MSTPPLSIRAWLRYDLLRPLLDRFRPGARLVEVGPGMGSMAYRLAARFDYTGVEPDETSASVAAARLAQLGRGRIIQGTLDALPAQERFDAACAFEVLEHICDDRRALDEWASRLLPGGALLLSVPAFQKRFGPSDERVGHYRRYEPDEIRRKVEAAGFTTPEVFTYGFPLEFVLEPARSLVARASRTQQTKASGTASSGRFFQPPAALGWLTRGATAPFRLVQRHFVNGGLGTGFVVFAQKSS